MAAPSSTPDPGGQVSPDFDINPDLTPEQRAFLLQQLNSSLAAFAPPNTPPRAAPGVKHEIHLTDPKPVKSAPYKQSPDKKAAVHEEVERLLEAGLIHESSSPWASPVSLVPKGPPDASGKRKWRMVIDYRRVNSQTRKDAYPVPLIEDCLVACKNADWMSIIDIKDAYHHIEVALESRGITAFVTSDGLFEWSRMPFGLSNAPATFQRYVDQQLRDFIGKFCAVFFDDCMVYTTGSLEQHARDVKRLLDRLHSVGLEASASKCRFAYKELLFVGHIVGRGTIRPDPSKIRAVEEFPVPTTVTALKGFLGLANYYRRFVAGFATIAHPLYELLKKGAAYEWSQHRQQAFVALKTALSRAPCLHAPDFTKKFILQTDASGVGISGVLSQITEGTDHPVGFVSRQLNKAEMNYSATEWECLAVVWAIGEFEPFLIDKPFTVVTDHAALKVIADKNTTNKRLARWALLLQEFSFDVQHRPGKANANADALSRSPLPGTAPPEPDDPRSASSRPNGPREAHFIRRSSWDSPIYPRWSFAPDATRCAAATATTEFPALDEPYQLTMVDLSELTHLAAAQKQDSHLRHLYNYVKDKQFPAAYEEAAKNRLIRLAHHFALLTNDDGVEALFYHPSAQTRGLSALAATPPRLVIPHSYRQHIMQLFHESAFGGHSGVKRTLSKIASRYYWDSLYTDVAHYVHTCSTCQQARVERQHIARRQGQIPAAMEPWESISIDYIGPLPRDQDFEYILLVVDNFTNYIVTVPTQSPTAGTTVQALMNEVICRFGLPRYILSDRGSHFRNRLFADLSHLLNIKLLSTSAYHPQSNGRAERFVSILKKSLSTTLKDYDSHWVMALQAVTFAINASPSTASAFSPHYLQYGYEPVFPHESLQSRTFERGSEESPLEAYALQLSATLHDAREWVRTISRQKARDIAAANAEHGNLPLYEPGDTVWLQDHRTKGKSGHRVFAYPYVGPFRVIRCLADGSAYIIRALRNGQPTGVQMTVNGTRLRPHRASESALLSPQHRSCCHPART